MKLSEKSSDKPISNTTNDADSDDDLFGTDFEAQMGKVAESCEKQYSRPNVQSDNFSSTSSNQGANKSN